MVGNLKNLNLWYKMNHIEPIAIGVKHRLSVSIMIFDTMAIFFGQLHDFRKIGILNYLSFRRMIAHFSMGTRTYLESLC